MLAKSESKCTLNLLNEKNKNFTPINMFEQKNMHGWLPVYRRGPRIGRREFLPGEQEGEGKTLTVSKMIMYDNYSPDILVI